MRTEVTMDDVNAFKEEMFRELAFRAFAHGNMPAEVRFHGRAP